MPAPGVYDFKSVAFESLEKPKFHMGQKLSHDDATKFIHSLPGPGTHEPSPQLTKKKAPTYSMGYKFNNTHVDASKWVPGPGAYVNNSTDKLRRTQPSFGFGSAKRPEVGYKRLNVPGPGSYKLPTKIADVPEFALANRKDTSKYV